MALAPVSLLKKTEIVWLGKNRCKHGHTYLAHYECFLKENPKNLRVGFFDIETSNLRADFGIMFCYCIKLLGKDEILHRVVTKEELVENLDKKIVQQCIDDITSLDRVVTYYGTKFDIPFLRTRAMHWGLQFPTFGQVHHDDVYYTIKSKFCLSRNRLENACRTLLGKTEKNHIDAIYWMRALQGDKKSLEYILDHCKRDVRDLERLYNNTIHFKAKSDRSI